MRRKQLVCLTAAVGVAAWAATYHLILGQQASPALLALYIFDAGLITYYLLAVGFARNFRHLPPAPGRILCLVPAFEEEPELLEAALRSLLNQTIPPDEIHVMDDGSANNPVKAWRHPKIHWYVQDNAGKRYAQANVLVEIPEDEREQWAYILTVDSDSVPAPDAVECLLRAMSKPEVMAVTGLIVTRNHDENWVTRIADVNIGTSCLMIRTSRSVIGAVETTSGALALYRAHCVFKNLDNYVASGTNGDDRRLTMYALLEGDVVVNNDAIVYSAMPATVRGTFKQRVRWGKSAWQALPFIAINLRPKLLIFPTLAMYQWVLLPPMIAWLVYSVIHHRLGHEVGMAFLAYLVIRYAETGMYLIDRPGMHWWTKLWTWLLLTPAEMLFKAAVIYPAKYWSVFKLRDRGWVSRGNAHGGPPKAARAPYLGRHSEGDTPTAVTPAAALLDAAPTAERRRPAPR